MSILKLILVAFVLASVSASPAHLQRLYGDGDHSAHAHHHDDHSHHHEHDHEHDHDSDHGHHERSHDQSHHQENAEHQIGTDHHPHDDHDHHFHDESSVTSDHINLGNNQAGANEHNEVQNNAQKGSIIVDNASPSADLRPQQLNNADVVGSSNVEAGFTGQRSVVIAPNANFEPHVTNDPTFNVINPNQPNLPVESVARATANVDTNSIGGELFEGNLDKRAQFDDFTPSKIYITDEVTVDLFTTITNIFYNSVPVTLTEFSKTTLTSTTLQVLTTKADDNVFVATAPVQRTETITVTDTNTAFRCATEVSTDIYTVTHSFYDINRRIVTSTVTETQVYRPTVVSTHINTEYETQTVMHTATSTQVVNLRNLRTSVVPHFLPTTQSTLINLAIIRNPQAGHPNNFVQSQTQPQNNLIRNSQGPVGSPSSPNQQVPVFLQPSRSSNLNQLNRAPVGLPPQQQFNLPNQVPIGNLQQTGGHAQGFNNQPPNFFNLQGSIGSAESAGNQFSGVRERNAQNLHGQNFNRPYPYLYPL